MATSNRTRLTAGKVASFACPAGKSQAFLWDTDAPSLLLRATPTGRKTYAFEARLNGQTVRVAIGDPKSWTLEDARKRANALRQQTDAGVDPRETARQQLAELENQRQKTAAAAVTVSEAWAAYVQDRRPYWGERHHADHLALVSPGGEVAKRGKKGGGLTVAGPLHALSGLRLNQLSESGMKAWAAREAATRPTSARLALRCFKAFLSWCDRQDAYAGLAPAGVASAREVREPLGKAKSKKDVLLKEQLPAWFSAVRDIGNPVVASALQVMLLTGARPGEILSMRWADVDERWRSLTMRDKVEGERTIPLTPYVQSLLSGLPRRNAMVFSSARSADGALAWPRHNHVKACAVAGIEGLTLHGLRRSFKSLTEWLEIPAGVVAQIQGHKPSATAEKHYTVRPLDLLRVHHERIEAWMLEQAGIEFKPEVKPRTLRAVK